MEPIWLERRKWPDLPHYRHHGVPLGEDEHGHWYQLTVGDPVYRGDEVLFHGQHGGLIVVPPGDASWMGWFLPPGRDFDLYVDIVSHVVRTPRSFYFLLGKKIHYMIKFDRNTLNVFCCQANPEQPTDLFLLYTGSLYNNVSRQ
jgi:hypothetical protein